MIQLVCEKKLSVTWNKVACLKESSEVHDFYLKTGSGFEGLGGTSRRYRPKLPFTAPGATQAIFDLKKKQTSSLKAKCKDFHAKIIFVHMRREWSFPYQWFYNCPGLKKTQRAIRKWPGHIAEAGRWLLALENKEGWHGLQAKQILPQIRWLTELVKSIESNKNLSFISLCL